jgi:hypothetical protein
LGAQFAKGEGFALELITKSTQLVPQRLELFGADRARSRAGSMFEFHGGAPRSRVARATARGWEFEIGMRGKGSLCAKPSDTVDPKDSFQRLSVGARSFGGPPLKAAGMLVTVGRMPRSANDTFAINSYLQASLASVAIVWGNLCAHFLI